MALNRWAPITPFSLMRNTMREMDAMFREAFDSPGSPAMQMLRGGTAPLPVDMFETADELVVKALLPGVDPEAVRITTERGMLRIEAHIGSDAEHEDAKDWRWHQHETWYGDVVRTLALPGSVDTEKAAASFRNGVLTLTFPKMEAARPRQIPVRLVSDDHQLAAEHRDN